MITLPSSVQIYFCVMPVDMRCSFDSLAELVRQYFQQEPRSGHMFVFRNKREGCLKVLYWDRDGYALWYKRLERGTLTLPSGKIVGGVEIDSTTLNMLLGGLESSSATANGAISRSAPVVIPEDLQTCQEMIRQLMQELAEKDGKIEDLLHRMNQMLRDKFGSKAERFDPGQLLLFAQQASVKLQSELPGTPTETVSKGSTSHGRRKPERQLPRRTVEYKLEGCDLSCPECGKERTEVGKETSEQYDYVPASVTVIEHVRYKYSCKVTAPGPQKAIRRGLATAGMLAYIATSKYADHQPLNRLEGIFKRDGAQICRSTMCDWVAGTATILRPLYEHMRQRVLLSKVIWTDDIPVKVQDRTHEKNIREGRVWV